MTEMHSNSLIEDCIYQNNTASVGGAIYLEGFLSIKNSSFYSN